MTTDALATSLVAAQLPDLPPCLVVHEDGTVRMGLHGIPLERIVFAYNHGQSAEEFVKDFPTVRLSEAFGALQYYLDHREQVDAYVEWIDDDADRMQAIIESAPGYAERQQKLQERMDAYRLARAERQA